MDVFVRMTIYITRDPTLLHRMSPGPQQGYVLTRLILQSRKQLVRPGCCVLYHHLLVRSRSLTAICR